MALADLVTAEGGTNGCWGAVMRPRNPRLVNSAATVSYRACAMSMPHAAWESENSAERAWVSRFRGPPAQALQIFGCGWYLPIQRQEISQLVEIMRPRWINPLRDQRCFERLLRCLLRVETDQQRLGRIGRSANAEQRESPLARDSASPTRFQPRGSPLPRTYSVLPSTIAARSIVPATVALRTTSAGVASLTSRRVFVQSNARSNLRSQGGIVLDLVHYHQQVNVAFRVVVPPRARTKQNDLQRNPIRR